MLLGHFKQEMFLQVYEAWLSLVERCVRDAEVAGSNPVASTFIDKRQSLIGIDVFIIILFLTTFHLLTVTLYSFILKVTIFISVERVSSRGQKQIQHYVRRLS